ncbi:MAG: hypothetical protein JNK15_10745 [Planctomycetes bacterium]|nr:hypothetical protein [Planctomycetota bacterium]
MPRTLAVLAAVLLAASASAQVIGIDDLSPSTGTSNAFPFSVTGGQTSLHVYSAATLRSLGVCAGAVLMDLEVAPSSGTAGTYSVPQAKLEIGHLAVSPPVPGNWAGHLASPIVVHDLTSGPYTFAWTLNTYVALPGFSTAFFVWDGVTDIGIQYTSSSGLTGGFNARRTATQLRHYVATFGATTQPPTSNGLFAMEVRMTWLQGNACATRVVYGAGCGSPALALASDLPVLGATCTLTTTNVPNLVPLGIVFVGDQQVPPPGFDLGALGAPGCAAWSTANLASATFPVAGGSGTFALPIPANPLLVGAQLTWQTAAFTLANPLNLATSNGVAWTLGY